MDPKPVIGALLATLLFVSQGQSTVAPAPLDSPVNQSSQANSQFVVIIDANPSSTRALGFRFFRNCHACQMELEEGEVINTSAGLSSYADNPKEVVPVIQRLVSEAERVVPAKERTGVPIFFEATGLRGLTQEQTDSLLAGARNVIDSSVFNKDDSVVEFLDPARQAVFTWATLNYLSGALYKTPEEMVGLVDLTDDTLQITFPDTNDAIESKDLRPFRVGYHDVKLHTLSIKELGIESARMGILSQDKAGSTVLYNSCMHSKYNGTSFTYNNTEYKVYSREGGLFFKIFTCQRSVSKYLTRLGFPSRLGLGAVKWFDFVSGPGLYKTVTSGESGFSSNGRSWEDVIQSKRTKECFSNTPEGPFSCLDISYINTLLTPFREVQFIEKINNQPVNWPLGLAFKVAQSLI